MSPIIDNCGQIRLFEQKKYNCGIEDHTYIHSALYILKADHFVSRDKFYTLFMQTEIDEHITLKVHNCTNYLAIKSI